MSDLKYINEVSPVEFFRALRESFKNKDSAYSYLLQNSDLLTEEEVDSLHKEFELEKYPLEEDFNLIEWE
jgi:hypothetical protein